MSHRNIESVIWVD